LPEKATQRLNLAQSFNGLATTLAPIIGAKIILTEGYSEYALNAMSAQAKEIALAAEASTVKMPYFILGSIILVIAIIFYFMKLPEIQEDKSAVEGAGILAVMKHKHLNWAIAAQFFM
jgi:FHS family L-fucose permease-like MFS transporter